MNRCIMPGQVTLLRIFTFANMTIIHLNLSTPNKILSDISGLLEHFIASVKQALECVQFSLRQWIHSDECPVPLR